MKTYRAISWVVDDEGRLVAPGGEATLSDDSRVKLGAAVEERPAAVDPVTPQTGQQELLQSTNAPELKDEPVDPALAAADQVPATITLASSGTDAPAGTDPARKEPEAEPAKAKGGAGKGSK